MKRVLLVFGTRPEAIKMAPLVKVLQQDTEHFETKVCVTAQHRQMLDQVLEVFGIVPEYDLNIMAPGQDLYDITSKVLLGLRDVLKDFAPDVVFHLAAQPLVRLSYDIPAETFGVNAIGTAHVLDAVRKINKPCTAILITTDKVYHNNEWNFPYRENDRLGGYDPYSASKACAELVIDSYRNSFFNRKSHNDHKKAIVSARAGNVIGGGDWAKDRLVPDIVRALHKGEEIVLRNPAAVRPWQHVLEPLGGYLLLGYLASVRYADLSNAYNFGPNPEDTLTVEQMTALATDIWGIGKYRVEQNLSAPHEAGLLKLDISLAKAELGWKPAMNAREALELTLQWYKTYYQDKGFISDLTEQQIQYFFSK